MGSNSFFGTETYQPAFEDAAPGKVAYNSASGSDEAPKLSTPDISYGLPYHEACAKHVRDTYHASRVYIVTSGSMSRNHPEALQKLIDALGKEHVVGVRKGMQSHTMWSEIIEIMTEMREQKADCLVTLGAGSITDGSKIAVLSLANNITTPKELGRYSVEASSPARPVHPPTIPLITIPTSLSGGEYFSLAGGTNDRTKHKEAFLHTGMGARLIILDPQLCTLTPPVHWLPSGVRAIDHCVETLCSLQATPTSDADATAGLKLLVPNLLATHADGTAGTNLHARHACHMGVLRAMKSVRAGIPMGGSHAIGHQLGPLGVPHGVTSCIMCPAVMKWNAAHTAHENYAEISRRQELVRDILWDLPEAAQLFHQKGLQRETADLGDLLDAIFTALEQPRTLKAVGIVDSAVIAALARRTLEDAWAPTNPVPLLEASKVQEILEMVRG